MVVKWSDDVEGPRVKLDGPLCGRLYKEDDGSIFTCSVTEPDEKMDCFTWSRKYNELVVAGDQYNIKFKNW